MPRLKSRYRGVLSFSIILIVVIALSVLSTLFLTAYRDAHAVLAINPGLNGPDIQLLENQNKGYERVIKSIAPSIVTIRTEQVVKAEQSPGHRIRYSHQHGQAQH